MPEKIIQPGLYADFDVDSYYADPCPTPSLTQSIAKVLIERSPAHARVEHPRLAPPSTADEPAEKYDAAKAIGNAAHALMLNRGKLIAEAQFKNFQSKIAQEFRDDPENAGKTVILSKHLTRAIEMVKAGRRQLEAMGLGNTFVGGQSEVVIAWKEGDLWFRSLIDWTDNLALMVDYKTSGLSCAPHAIAPMIEKAGWHIQSAMHERGLDVLDPDGAGRRTFRFIAQENEPPYALTVVDLDEHWLSMGRKMLDRAVTHWALCLSANEWPSYPPKIVTPAYPQYAETRWLNREIEETGWTDHPKFREAQVGIRKSRAMLTDLSGG